MMRQLVLFLVSGLLPALQAATLARRPYLQNVGETHVSILWTTTATPGEGVVRAAGREFRSRVFVIPPAESELSAPIFQHQADLSGLAPDTTYPYEVLIDGVAVYRGVLRTAGASRYQFLAFGDSGDGGQPQRQLAGLLNRETPAFVIHTGDVAYYEGRFEQYDGLYFSVYTELMARAPFYPAMGNHDAMFRNGLAFRTVHAWPGRPVPYYSFDWGDAHFVALDTNQSLDDAVEGAGDMLRWLERDLHETRKLLRVVFFHHPPFPTANYRGDARCQRVAEQVVPILERAGVHLVLSGHEHLYQRVQPRNGTIYVTTGGGGSTVYPPGNDSFIAYGAGVSHYLRLSVAGARITGEAINAEGAVFDTFEIRATPEVSGVTNAAGAAAPAPGGLASLFGANLIGAKLRFGSTEVPVIYDSWRQVNFRIPENVPSGEAVLTTEGRGGVATTTIQLAKRAPYIFRTASGVAAITHADHRLVTGANAARPGEWVAVYLTGLGPLPVTVRVEVAGSVAEVSYAGDAPGLPGVNQVNFRIPDGVPDGEMNLVLRVETATANAVIPIRPVP